MIKKGALKAIKFYQAFISPSMGQHCRFYPSCSEYIFRSIEKNGLLAGSLKGVKRILRCGQWSKGGVDLP